MGVAVRLPIALLGSLAFSAAMFWFLYTMITGPTHLGDLKPPIKIDFTPQRRDTQTQTKQDKPERPKITQVPKIPSITTSSAENVGGSVLMTRPDVNLTGLNKLSLNAGSDREVIPLVRINPEYPQRAASRGLEGWVQVEFTISPAGTVSGARVVEADPKGVFEDAALKAIGRWKYNPKVIDGKAVERRGIQVVLTFELEDKR